MGKLNRCDPEKFPKTNVYEMASKVADLLVENRVEWALVPSVFKKATEMIENNMYLSRDSVKTKAFYRGV